MNGNGDLFNLPTDDALKAMFQRELKSARKALRRFQQENGQTVPAGFHQAIQRLWYGVRTFPVQSRVLLGEDNIAGLRRLLERLDALHDRYACLERFRSCASSGVRRQGINTLVEDYELAYVIARHKIGKWLVRGFLQLEFRLDRRMKARSGGDSRIYRKVYEQTCNSHSGVLVYNLHRLRSRQSDKLLRAVVTAACSARYLLEQTDDVAGYAVAAVARLITLENMVDRLLEGRLCTLGLLQQAKKTRSRLLYSYLVEILKYGKTVRSLGLDDMRPSLKGVLDTAGQLAWQKKSDREILVERLNSKFFNELMADLMGVLTARPAHGPDAGRVPPGSPQ